MGSEVYLLYSAILQLHISFQSSLESSRINVTSWGNSNKKYVKKNSVVRTCKCYKVSSSIHASYTNIQKALYSISDDTNQKRDTRLEAESLAAKLDTLEIALMTVIWDSVLQRVTQANLSLQKSNIDLGMGLQLYDSLNSYIVTLGNDEMFDEFETSAQQLSNSDSYAESNERRKK